jgi:hypothetical protein
MFIVNDFDCEGDKGAGAGIEPARPRLGRQVVAWGVYRSTSRRFGCLDNTLYVHGVLVIIVDLIHEIEFIPLLFHLVDEITPIDGQNGPRVQVVLCLNANISVLAHDLFKLGRVNYATPFF